jgi:hypothetical protein
MLLDSCFFLYFDLLVSEPLQLLDDLVDQVVYFLDLLIQLLGALDRLKVVL